MPIIAWCSDVCTSDLAAEESAILGYHNDPHYNRGPFMRGETIRRDCADKMRAFDVRPPVPALKTANFSGGNQQKMVLARELSRAPRLLLVGQPTRGVDIGAIEFNHRNLLAMRGAGSAVVLVGRKSVVEGKRGSIRGDLGGARI